MKVLTIPKAVLPADAVYDYHTYAGDHYTVALVVDPPCGKHAVLPYVTLAGALMDKAGLLARGKKSVDVIYLGDK